MSKKNPDKVWAAWCVATYDLFQVYKVKPEDYDYVISRMMDAIKMRALLRGFAALNSKKP